MYSPEQILRAAKNIYPALPKLLDGPLADKMQTTLQSLLDSQDSEGIWKLLDQHPQTQQWRRNYLQAINNPCTRSGSQLAGEMVPEPSGLIYACPSCDRRSVVFFLGMEPEPCLKHPDATLKRV